MKPHSENPRHIGTCPASKSLCFLFPLKNYTSFSRLQLNPILGSSTSVKMKSDWIFLIGWLWSGSAFAQESMVTTSISTTSLSRDCSGIPGIYGEACGLGYYCYIGYYSGTPEYLCALVSTPPPATAVGPYGQCGGIGYAGLTNCIPGYTCVRDNDYFSQCFQISVSATSTPSALATSSIASTPKQT
jgi:hypothetical protein